MNLNSTNILINNAILRAIVFMFVITCSVNSFASSGCNDTCGCTSNGNGGYTATGTCSYATESWDPTIHYEIVTCNPGWCVCGGTYGDTFSCSETNPS